MDLVGVADNRALTTFLINPLQLLQSNAEAGPSTPRTTDVSTFPKSSQALLQSALRGSRPASALNSRSASSSTLGSSQALYNQPTAIATAQQFHEHFSHLTSSLLHSQDALYRSHLAEISGYKEACDVLDKELEESSELVNGMIECLRWVEEKGESLRVAGEGLMQEEVRWWFTGTRFRYCVDSQFLLSDSTTFADSAIGSSTRVLHVS